MAESLAGARNTVHTVCGVCGPGCGLSVTVENGAVSKIEGTAAHAASRGYVCRSAMRFVDTQNHPDRLKYPLRRSKNGWQRVTWDEALGEIAEKLLKIKSEYGARALAVSMGQKMITQGPTAFSFIRRFTDAFGTPNVYSSDSFCWRATIIADLLTIGRVISADTAHSKCIILWGTNFHDATTSRSAEIRAARSAGAQTIVVDPRVTHDAKSAEVHLRPRPGTDCALLLGMLHVIAKEGLYDREFVAQWTTGFDELVQRLDEYPLEKVEQITSVPAETIRQAARLYATTKPASIIVGWLSFQETRSGVHASRAVDILQAITGNLDVEGGAVIPSGGLHLNSLRLASSLDEKPLNTDQNPLFYQTNGVLLGDGEGQSIHLPDAMITGNPYPIKAMIVSAQNPMLGWSETKKVRRALQNLDLLVVMDLFMSETAELAHFVLPSATWLERTNLYDHYRQLFGVPFAALQRRVTQHHEARSDTEFYLALAKKLGMGEQFPWDTYEDVLAHVLAPCGFTFEQLTEVNPEGVLFAVKGERKAYERRGFRTPSGRVEISSQALRELGHDPLPVHIEPSESPVSQPELAKEYPLILVVGTRRRPWSGSMFRNVPSMLKVDPRPVVELHPDTAAACGVQDGDRVALETKRGAISLWAECSEDAMPGVAQVTIGWKEANANELTECAVEDPISGFPRRTHLCRITKLDS